MRSSVPHPAVFTMQFAVCKIRYNSIYQTEIDKAKAANRPDIVEALERLWEKEAFTLGRERRE